MEGANLVEFHTKQDKPNQPVDKQVYSMQDGKLVQVREVIFELQYKLKYVFSASATERFHARDTTNERIETIT